MKSLYSLFRTTALKTPKAIALSSPNQLGRLGKPFSYEELDALSIGLGMYLQSNAVARGSVVVSDLPNITENLALQMTCSRLKVAFATVKDAEGLKQLRDNNNVFCVPTSKVSWLSDEFSGNSLLGEDFESAANEWICNGELESEKNGPINHDTEDLPHAYFNSLNALSGEEIVTLGTETANKMNLTETDRVLVAITLCHAFGIGSGVGSAFSRGACVVLPAVGGIRGCGVPSERAIATLKTLMDTKASLLLADAHIIKNFPANVSRIEGFRGGIVKTGSGSTFLKETINFASVELNTMGKA